MEKLTRKEYQILLELIENEKNEIHQQAIHNKELREKEVDLDFISIKINSQLKMLDDKLDYMMKRIEG